MLWVDAEVGKVSQEDRRNGCSQESGKDDKVRGKRGSGDDGWIPDKWTTGKLQNVLCQKSLCEDKQKCELVGKDVWGIQSVENADES